MKTTNFLKKSHRPSILGMIFLLAGWCVIAPDALAQTTVPKLTGKPLEQARQIARVHGIPFCSGVFYISPEHWRDDIHRNVVYMQTPKAGVSIPPKTTAACWTFKKATKKMQVIPMPDLQNLSLEKAVEKIRIHKLRLMSPLKTVRTKGGTVVGQYPRPRQPVYEGTSVFVIVQDRS